MNQIFQIPATLTKAEMRVHFWKLVFETQENVTPDQMAVVIGWAHQLGWLTYSAHQIEAEHIIDLPEIKTDDTKTPSQRLRDVLYRLWEQSPEGHKTFATYYPMMMEKITTHFKRKLI